MIALDARPLNIHAFRGIATYTRNLILGMRNCNFSPCLLSNKQLDKYNNQQLILPYQIPLTNNKIKNNLIQRANNIFSNFLLESLLSKEKINLIHFTDFLETPNTKNINKIITVYDLIHLKFPDFFFKGIYKLNYPKYMKYLKKLKDADHIITISQSTKNDLIHFTEIDENKISVIHLASDFIFNNAEQLEKIETTETLPYFLYVGGGQKHKNLNTLIKAFDIVADSNTDISLCLLGKDLINSEYLQKSINRLKHKNRIIIRFVKNNTDLINYYKNAIALIHPSLYEGFGLTILEAMACGTPVISSNTSSLPEVYGSSALSFKPSDIEELIFNMEKLLSDKQLTNDLSNKGLINAKKFSWTLTAKKTIEIYNKFS